MKLRTGLSLLCLGLLALSAACNLPKANTEAGQKATGIVETAAALLTGTAASLPTPVPATAAITAALPVCFTRFVSPRSSC